MYSVASIFFDVVIEDLYCEIVSWLVALFHVDKIAQAFDRIDCDETIASRCR